MNNYILSYNPLTLSPTAGMILNHVRFNRYITQYWQPFAGTYLLKSEQIPYVLNDSLKGFFESATYMLTQFSPDLAGGALPREIWAWINQGAVPQPTATTNYDALSGYSKMLGDIVKP